MVLLDAMAVAVGSSSSVETVAEAFSPWVVTLFASADFVSGTSSRLEPAESRLTGASALDPEASASLDDSSEFVDLSFSPAIARSGGVVSTVAWEAAVVVLRPSNVRTSPWSCSE